MPIDDDYLFCPLAILEQVQICLMSLSDCCLNNKRILGLVYVVPDVACVVLQEKTMALPLSRLCDPFQHPRRHGFRRQAMRGHEAGGGPLPDHFVRPTAADH